MIPPASGKAVTRMNVSPTFSLVVATLARTSALEILFDSIKASDLKDFEVIVVDQNRDGRLDEICRRYESAFLINHLKVDFKGAARARNYGVRFASGKYLNFPDDDCELLPDTLIFARELLDGMSLKLLNGRCLDRLGGASTTRFIEDERYLTPWRIWGRNIEFTTFFEREAFLAVGGYDERFGVGSNYGADEGPEILIRLLSTLPAHQAYYSHRLRFIHPDKAVDYSETGARRAFSYARGRGALLAKWPILPMYRNALKFLTFSVLGRLLFRGGKGRCYWRRLEGFVSGYTEFRKMLREENGSRAQA